MREPKVVTIKRMVVIVETPEDLGRISGLVRISNGKTEHRAVIFSLRVGGSPLPGVVERFDKAPEAWKFAAEMYARAAQKHCEEIVFCTPDAEAEWSNPCPLQEPEVQGAPAAEENAGQ